MQKKYVKKWITNEQINHELRENIYFGFVLMPLLMLKLLK